jgi:hypothetical protein
LLAAPAAAQVVAPVDLDTLFAQPSASAPLKLAFEADAVVVSGVPAGARLAWLSLASEPHRYWVRHVRREGVETDADGDGAVRVAVDGGVPPRSVWGVVELETGEAVWAAPEGFALVETAARPEDVRQDGRGRLNRLLARRVGLELLWGRPGKGAEGGAWGLTVVDGAPEDRDGAPDGGVAAAFEEARPLGESPPAPGELRPGDVVLGIDPRTYEVFALRLPGGGPAK